MISRKKRTTLILGIVSLVLVALLSIAGAFAFGTGKVTSNVSVSYNAIQVKGTVSATYQGGSISTAKSMTADGTSTGATTVSFEGTETTAKEGTLKPLAADTLALDATNSSMEFVFTFTNSGDEDYTATLGTLPTGTNVKISVKKASTDSYATYDKDATNSVSVSKKASGTDGSATYYIKVEIDEKSIDASFSGDIVWNLAA